MLVNVAEQPHTVADGYLSMEGGVDSGFVPNLIEDNQGAWAVNATSRGGYWQPRPGFKHRALTFPSAAVELAMREGLFQGAGTYLKDDGSGTLALSVSGKIYSIDINTWKTTDITIAGDPNEAAVEHAWFQQAENTLVVQNNVNKPFLWNGTSSRRSIVAHQVPVGGPMAYLKGRLWVTRGSQFFGGDLVNSYIDLGRESVLEFKENDFYNEGGAYSAAREITGLAVSANIDTTLGDGDLLIFTISSVYAFNAPSDRTIWKNLRYPIQRVALINAGATSAESISVVNSDLMFRSENGVNSFRYSRNDFAEWGNTPISRQAVRAFQFDTDTHLKWCSSCNFDNRLLMTCQPVPVKGRGMVHLGLAALDYYLVSGMGRKANPAWDGVWTGLRILRILTLQNRGSVRCFIFALDSNDRIELWELTKNQRFDIGPSGEDTRIKWTIEGKSFAFQTPRKLKKLRSADQWYDELTGQLDVTVRWRPNLMDCWTPWANWSACATYKDCDPAASGACQTPRYLREQVRPRMALQEPPEVPDVQTGGFRHIGYEFQMRMEFEGFARLNRLILVADQIGDSSYGDMTGNACITYPTGTCETGCKALECCDPDDFVYKVGPAGGLGAYIVGQVLLATGGPVPTYTGYPGSQIKLIPASAPLGPAYQSTVTAADGFFSFGTINAGSYLVNITVPTGHVIVGSTSLPVTVAAGATSAGNNFTITLYVP